MGSIDAAVVQAAMEEFGKNFAPQVMDLGYTLAYGFGPEGDSFTLIARVQDPNGNGFPKEVMDRINGMLGTTFQYQGDDIPIKIVYIGSFEPR